MFKVYENKSWNYHTHERYQVNHEIQFFDTREKAYEYLLNIERENKGFLDYEGTEMRTNTDYYTLLLGSKAIQYAIECIK